VLERYIAMATEAGVTQAVYPEGGLTRDGLMREPRFGVLDYMLRGFHMHGERDLVFVPLGLNYDRVLEDRTQLLGPAATPRPPRTGAHGGRLAHVRFVARRSGCCCAAAGTASATPASTSAPRCRCAPGARRATSTLAACRASPVRRRPGAGGRPDAAYRCGDPGAAGGAGRHGLRPRDPFRALSLLEVKSSPCWRSGAALEASGARLYVPRQDQDYAIEVGLRMLTLRRLLVEREGLLAPSPGELPVLAYYANSIAHLAGAAG
jgi:glycerol-3-phosphate O-acyltransferase